jgi:hypothetical protein
VGTLARKIRDSAMTRGLAELRVRNILVLCGKAEIA